MVEPVPQHLKPHYGKLDAWNKRKEGAIHFFTGMFVDHPRFAGKYGHTSYMVSHDEDTGEIETRNSRYTLGKPGV